MKEEMRHSCERGVSLQNVVWRERRNPEAKTGKNLSMLSMRPVLPFDRTTG